MADDKKDDVQSWFTLYSDWERLIKTLDILPPQRVDPDNPDTVKQYTITITQPSQTDAKITVKTIPDGKAQTATFKVDENTSFMAYIDGTNKSNLLLNNNGGIVTSDITLTATAAKPDDNASRCAVIIMQDFGDDQKIVGNINDGGFTQEDTLFVDPGSKAEFQLTTNFARKWDLGKLNVTKIDPILKNINYVYATPPTIRSDYDPTIAIITITQSKNQTIHVYTPGTDGKDVDNTKTFTCKIDTKYTAKVIPDIWYGAGALNIQPSGNFLMDTNVTVTDAYIITDYDVNITVVQYPEPATTTYGSSMTYLWDTKTGTHYGNITPYYVVDVFQLNPDNTIHLAFWGPNPVTGLFKTFDCYMVDSNNTPYQICSGIPNSQFNATGDVNLAVAQITDSRVPATVRANVNKPFRLHVHINL